MPINIPLFEYAIDSSGGNFSIEVKDQTPTYIVTGSATMIGNLQFTPSANVEEGTCFTIKWRASLDIDTNGTSVLIFGTPLTNYQCLNPQTIYCLFYGGIWIVEVHSDFASNNIINTNHIENLSVTTGKIADGAVTNAKLDPTGISNIAANSIDATMLQTASVTNIKINPGPNNSLKVTDNVGAIDDFALGTDELIIGSVTGLTTVLKSDLTLGTPLVFIVPVSFEMDEQGLNAFYVPVNCVIDEVRVCVTKTLSGTDDATLAIYGNNGINHYLPDLTITQGTTIDTMLASAVSGGTLSANTMTYVQGLKTTVGGKCLVTITAHTI